MPAAVGDERRPRSGQQSAARARRPSTKATAKQFIEAVRQALYASKICSYAQGFVQMQAAAEEHDWPLDLRQHRPAVARRLHHPGAFLGSHQRSVRRRQEAGKPAARAVLPRGVAKSARLPGGTWWRPPCNLGIWTPAFATALAYYDGFRQDRLPANLLQAQRDYFGAHTYERIDKPGTFHTDWLRFAAQTEVSIHGTIVRRKPVRILAARWPW